MHQLHSRTGARFGVFVKVVDMVCASQHSIEDYCISLEFFRYSNRVAHAAMRSLSIKISFVYLAIFRLCATCDVRTLLRPA